MIKYTERVIGDNSKTSYSVFSTGVLINENLYCKDRIESVDENMKIYDGLISYLDKSKDVKYIKKAMTFETPISDYEYKDIPFSVLFDEMCDETFVFVEKLYDYRLIEQLLHKFDIIN